MLDVELEDIKREKFDKLLAKHQIRQYFPLSINCAMQYFHNFCSTYVATVFLENTHLINKLRFLMVLDYLLFI